MALQKYTNEELLRILKEYVDQNGLPRSKDFQAKYGLPTNELFRERFGSWYNALNLAGVDIPKDKEKYFQNDRLSDEKILSDLRNVTEKHLKTNLYLLKTCDFIKYPDIQCYSVYVRRFGGLKESYAKIGYDYDAFNKVRMEDDMIIKMQELALVLGHTPTNDDLNNNSSRKNPYYYCAKAYIDHFGSIYNAQIISGLEPVQAAITRNMSEDDFIKLLIEFYERTGRYPSQNDVNAVGSNMPSYTAYSNKFGSWEVAIRKAFGKDIKRISQKWTTPKGNICRSMLEYSFACMLEKYNIDYLIDEIYYKDYINSCNRDYRFDFLIKHYGIPIFIEIFGFENFDKYNEVKAEKIKLCEDNGLLLIDLYQKDIYKKTQSYLYEKFIKKLNALCISA